ncbi:hypothetical protein ABZ958_37680 [Streptomyces sp. NPDC046237]|uniref:hypothetical protein n=1 Tax=Streptomyces sp. NPDC046237 TaxID=3154914 RepID=UPI0033F13E41
MLIWPSTAGADGSGGDLCKGVLESADGVFRLYVFLRSRKDRAEGAALVSRQSAPAQDRFECVEGAGEEPGHAAVCACEGDGQDGEGFPQVFEPVDPRQRLLGVCRAVGALVTPPACPGPVR